MRKQTPIRLFISLALMGAKIGFMALGLLIILAVMKGMVSFGSAALSPPGIGLAMTVLLAGMLLWGRKHQMTAVGFFHKGSDVEELAFSNEDLKEDGIDRETLTAVTRPLDMNR